MAFSRIYRLRESRRVQLVLKKGRKVYAPFFRVHFLENKFQQLQITVIVSRKIESRAVARNKIRRRLQEAIWGIIQKNNVQKEFPFFLVFLGNSSILATPFSQLLHEVEVALKKIKSK